jgi:hypothetical protein
MENMMFCIHLTKNPLFKKIIIKKNPLKKFLLFLLFAIYSVANLYAENYIILQSRFDNETYNFKFSLFDTQNNIKIGEYNTMISQPIHLIEHNGKIYMHASFDQKLLIFDPNDLANTPPEYPIRTSTSDFTIVQDKLFFLSASHHSILVYELPSIEFLGLINTQYNPFAISSNDDKIFVSNNEKEHIDFIEVFNAKTHCASPIHNLTDYNPANEVMTSLSAFNDGLLILTNEGTQLIGLILSTFETEPYHLNKKLFSLKRHNDTLYGLSASKKIIYKIENGNLIEAFQSENIIDDFCVIDFEIKKEQKKIDILQSGTCNIL